MPNFIAVSSAQSEAHNNRGDGSGREAATHTGVTLDRAPGAVY
jgi:hypothetical protein